MLRINFIFGFVFFVVQSLSAAFAHEIVPTIATLKFADARAYNLELRVNLEAQIAKIGPEHEDTDDAPSAQLYNELRALGPVELQKRFEAMAQEDGAKAWISNVGLNFSGQAADLKLEEIVIPPIGDVELARETLVIVSGDVPSGAKNLTWSFPKNFGTSVLRIERPGQELQARFFAAGVTSEEIAIGVAKPRSFMEKVWDYGVIGFTHILPKGMDHILFVLGLFLLSTQWRPLLVQVTAFTLAHSVTLALGLYGIVQISPSIVEPLIALSIVYVAVENIFTKVLNFWRPIIVFLFGLLHGLGFAGILTEIGLPKSDFVLGLVSFNVGVELGQLTVIAVAFALVGWFVKKSWYRAAITVPASIAIGLMGAWWFVERTIL